MIVVVDSITRKEAIELGHVKIKILLAAAREDLLMVVQR